MFTLGRYRNCLQILGIQESGSQYYYGTFLLGIRLQADITVSVSAGVEWQERKTQYQQSQEIKREDLQFAKRTQVEPHQKATFGQRFEIMCFNFSATVKLGMCVCVDHCTCAPCELYIGQAHKCLLSLEQFEFSARQLML